MEKNILKDKFDIVIKGAYGAENFGDDALIYSILESFFINKNIAVIGKKNTYWSKLFPETSYFSIDENIYIEADVLVHGGGTQFYNFKSNRYFIKKLITVLKNPSIILNKFFRKEGVKITFKEELYLSVGLGPFQDEKRKEAVIDEISNNKDIYVRDYLSLKYLDNKAFKVDDLCLMDHKRYKTKLSDNKNNKIAIIIRDWDFDSNYIHTKKIVEFFEKNKNYSFDFIFFGSDKKSKGILSDKDIPFIEWNPHKNTILGFSDLLSQYNLIISSRYHGIIFSLIHEIPSIAIEIEPKLSQVSKEYPNIGLWASDYDFSKLNELIKSGLNTEFKNSFEIFDINDLNEKLEATFF